MSLEKSVWRLFFLKGRELRRDPGFSEADWDDYVISIGCEPIQDKARNIIGGYEEGESVFVRDENHTAFCGRAGQLPRFLKMGKETAMRIAVLGLP